ncbi:hypothetical protein [Dyella tabacisoli]|uniref:Uncharacterized protein n=1 Tax=Dyella tabacisoli TaxID=2282381 RepID=A0A369UIU4_9GAMM|nr:hypothetical protein [Dyella tabacisoli]RDD80466.1 hypothetical protein DVJ77_16315 [Dyella tabacisoli]
MAHFAYLSDRDILLALAEGKNPLTGELLPEAPLLNDTRVIRALFHAADALAHSVNVGKGADVLASSHGPWVELAVEQHHCAQFEVTKPASEVWDRAQDLLLMEAFEAGIALDEVAKWLGRTKEALTLRLDQLGKS